MGWTNSHLHHFRVGEQLFGDPDLMQENFEEMGYEDSTSAKLSDILPRSGRQFALEYEYDFGDGWRYEVLLEGCLRAERGKRYPVCLEGARTCPPEDVGGTWGYEVFLEAMADRRDDSPATSSMCGRFHTMSEDVWKTPQNTARRCSRSQALQSCWRWCNVMAVSRIGVPNGGGLGLSTRWGSQVQSCSPHSIYHFDERSFNCSHPKWNGVARECRETAATVFATWELLQRPSLPIDKPVVVWTVAKGLLPSEHRGRPGIDDPGRPDADSGQQSDRQDPPGGHPQAGCPPRR
jgi:hypothetical protein